MDAKKHINLGKAEKIADNPTRLKRLLQLCLDKLKDLNINDKRIQKITKQAQIGIRMLLAYIKGEYRDMPWKSIVLIVAALLYFITPLDFIPDFIPISGLLDDLGVFVWVYQTIHKDITKFEAWEADNTTEANS